MHYGEYAPYFVAHQSIVTIWLIFRDGRHATSCPIERATKKRHPPLYRLGKCRLGMLSVYAVAYSLKAASSAAAMISSRL